MESAKGPGGNFLCASSDNTCPVMMIMMMLNMLMMMMAMIVIIIAIMSMIMVMRHIYLSI